jgi:hypothetical protein
MGFSHPSASQMYEAVILLASLASFEIGIDELGFEFGTA